MLFRELNIELKNHPYKIIVENGLLDNVSKYISDVYKGNKIFIVTDDVVEKLYLNKVMNSLNNKGLI